MDENSASEKKLTVRAVERSLDILSCFIDSTELSLTEISKRISLHKSTVHRLLNTLEEKGFIIKNPETEKFRLGFRIWELSANLTGMDDPATVFLPEMQMLRDTLGETVSLYVRDGYERIRIQSVESRHAVRRVAPIGVRMPLSVGAASKILIAYEEPNIRNTIMNQLETLYQINREFYEKIVLEVQEKGYATSFEEREIGAVAISFPIFNRKNKLIAALTVSGPANRFTFDTMKEVAPIIMEVTSAMSKKMNK